MSHTNQINETQSDENECSVNDLDSANEIVSGKYIYRLIKPVQYIVTCVRAFVHLINVFCHCIRHFTTLHTLKEREKERMRSNQLNLLKCKTSKQYNTHKCFVC